MYPLERVWQHSWNTAPASFASQLAMSQATMMFMASLFSGTATFTNATGGSVGSPAGTWACLGSSDSVTAALDGSKRLLDTTYTKWVYATAGTAHSWIVYGPGPSGAYVNFDYSSSSGNNYVAIYQSKTAPTGGSITARPTSVDETNILTLQLNDGTPNGSTVWSLHGLLSTSGDVFMGVNKNGSLFLQSAFWFTYFGNPKVGDTCPWAMFGEFSGTPPGVPSAAIHASGNWRTRPPDNSGTQGTSTPASCMVLTGALGSWDSSWAAGGDGEDASYAGWPMPFTSNSTSSGGTMTLRGRIIDVRSASVSSGSATPNNSVEPATGNPDAVILATVWLPCNVTSVQL